MRVVILPGFDDPFDVTAQGLKPRVDDLGILPVRNHAIAVAVDEQNRYLGASRAGRGGRPD